MACVTLAMQILIIAYLHAQHLDRGDNGGGTPCARHIALLTHAAGRPIGCARLLPDGHVGRMAVLRPWRGRGVGRALLQAALARAALAGFTVVRLNAQVHALDFYRREGFEAFGDVFSDAGIPHRAMQRVIERR
jgi:predicted GNAT family N-acyltransferase